MQPTPATAAAREAPLRSNEVVGEHYVIVRQIGEGGMSTVFLAEDRKHHRLVAIKVLQEALAHSIGLQRFLQEIDVLARLQHPHLLTLIDSGEVGGLPYFVMPYVEAHSLRELLATSGPLPVDEAVRIGGEIADGLQFAHDHGVVHRDIKPSNILLSGGHAVIVDFGIAAALQNAAVGRLTDTGISIGSPTYMSPEQAAAERELDARTDVYSLGCVMYELLCGEPPIDAASMQQIFTRKFTGDFRPLRERRADVPAALADAITRALALDREQRWPSMREFAAAMLPDIPAAAPGRQRVGRRTVAFRAAAAVLALVVIGWWTRSERRKLWAAEQIGEISRLSTGGEFARAFELSERVGTVMSANDAMRRLRPAFEDFFPVVTSPAGARIYRRRVDRSDSPWEQIGVTPMDSVGLPKNGADAPYEFRIEKEGYETRELLPNVFAVWANWRGVRPLDTLRLDRVPGVDTAMVRIPGWRMRDSVHAGGDSITFADYYVAKREVTNREFKRFVDAGGYAKREYWREPFVRDGRSVSFDEAMISLRDRTGLPGPATWSGGTYPDGEAEFPVSGVSWYEAMAYARFAGASLPTTVHWNRAALRHARETAWLYMPTSRLNATSTRRAGEGVINAYGLYDVAGNVREWCVNPLEMGHTTMGGAYDDPEFLVPHFIPKPEFDRSPGNGVRLVKVADADTTLAHVSGRITRPVPRDYTHVKPASDAEFAVFRRLYDYDKAPLAPHVDTTGIREQYRFEKVSFSGPTGERMAAFVLLPKEARPPYQAVLFWPGSNALSARSFLKMRFVFDNLFGFIPRSGRVLVVPLFKGTFERDDSTFSLGGHPPEGSKLERDLGILWHQELRRTIDYLETRRDIRADAIGFYGFSWGGREGPIALAIEPRIRAGVLNVGGFGVNRRPLPEIDPVNFAARVRTPVLMLNGRHDVVFPYESSQLPLFRMLGTPAADKKHVVYPAGHALPQQDQVRETLAWLEKYLGPSQP